MNAFISLLILTMGVSSLAQTPIAKLLDAEIKKSKVPVADLGLCVLDEHGSEVYGLNQNTMMTPASLTKLLTAAASLQAFTPATKFETLLMSEAPVKNGVLEGNLYLKGGGDPSFVSEKMWYLVNEFTRNRIIEISGQVVVDDSLFDTERFDPGRDPARVNRAYDSPIGAASFNWNAVNVFVRPAEKAGALAYVVADPVSPYMKVDNKVKTTASGAATLTIDRIDGAQTDTVRISGTIPLNSSEIVKYVSVSKPDYWAGYHLVEFLKQRGISVKGGISIGKTPVSASVLAKAESVPMYEILADMLKFSNNYIAEMLTKQLSVKAGAAQGTMSGGLNSLAGYLAKLGINSSDYILTSPSGLSQKNKIKPKKLCDLLYGVKKDLKMFPEIAAGLPLAGVDGTIKSRMKGTKAEGRVRGKTGLLTGAIGLSGYAGRSDGSTLIYVFIYNGDHGNQTIWPLFDAMAARLVE